MIARDLLGLAFSVVFILLPMLAVICFWVAAFLKGGIWLGMIIIDKAGSAMTGKLAFGLESGPVLLLAVVLFGPPAAALACWMGACAVERILAWKGRSAGLDAENGALEKQGGGFSAAPTDEAGRD